MLDVICFSHRRQLQLHGYLESLFHYCDPNRVVVIYPSQDYSGVISAFPNVEFIEESLGFHQTLMRVASGIESSMVMFGCDDMVFTRTIPLLAAKWSLADSRVLGYSIRLHDGIENVSTRVWDWTEKTRNAHCCYPFDLTGTIYRSGFVKDMLADIRETKGPNSLEWVGVEFAIAYMRRHCPLLSRGEYPSCFIQQVNNVQVEIPAKTSHLPEQLQPERLDELYRDGKRLDWKSMAGVAFSNVWSNGFWKLC